MPGIEDLPAAQADSLRAAIGLSSGAQVERIACYAAVVNLLAAAARTRPVVVVADDLQWFDAGSRDAILFAARRVHSDPLAFVLAIRDGETESPLLTGLPELRLDGLAEAPALDLIARNEGDVSPEVARRLWSQTAGDPLALTEIPRHLSSEQRAGRVALSEPLPVGQRLEASFVARAAVLPETCQHALLVAAASYTGATDAIFDALTSLDLPPGALEPAEEDGLITIADGLLSWRHPLVRSAIYHAASTPAQRAAHAALASSAARAAYPITTHGISRRRPPARTRRSRPRSSGSPATRFAAAHRRPLCAPSSARPGSVPARPTRRGASSKEPNTHLPWGAGRRRSNSWTAPAGAPTTRCRVRRASASGPGWRCCVATHTRRTIGWSRSPRRLRTSTLRAAAVMTEAAVGRTMTGPVLAYRATAERAFALARPVGGDAEAIAALALGCGLVLSGDTAGGLELFARYGGVAEKPELWVGP